MSGNRLPTCRWCGRALSPMPPPLTPELMTRLGHSGRVRRVRYLAALVREADHHARMACVPTLTPADAAPLVGVARCNVYTRIHSGSLPAVQVEGRWRIPAMSVTTE